MENFFMKTEEFLKKIRRTIVKNPNKYILISKEFPKDYKKKVKEMIVIFWNEFSKRFKEKVEKYKINLDNVEKWNFIFDKEKNLFFVLYVRNGGSLETYFIKVML